MPKTLTARNCPDALHRALKTEAARQGLTLRQAITQAIERWLTVSQEKGRT